MSADLGFQPVTTGKRIFISYKKEDAERVGRIARCLYGKGVPLWYDKGIPMDAEWEKKIGIELAGCESMILFVTKLVFRDVDTYVKIEHDVARKDLNKPIYTVFLDEIDSKRDVCPELLPWYRKLKNHQCIEGAGVAPETIARKIITDCKLLPTTSDDGTAVGIGFLTLGILLCFAIFAANSYSVSQGKKEIHVYHYVHSDVSWERAWDESIAAGGYLACINSPEEFDYIVNILDNGYPSINKKYVYLGGQRDKDSIYHWKNKNGEFGEDDIAGACSWYREYWYSGEPSFEDPEQKKDGINIDENCVCLMNVSGRWYFDDVSEDLPNAYYDGYGKGVIGYIIEFDKPTPVS